jgi:hypothetical protein
MAQEDEPTSEQVMPGRAGEILGMNVRGNKESPLTLTIVPWRSAEHNQQDPEIRPGWSPQLKLLQPAAYRRSINAFLISRKVRSPAQAEGRQNENQ